MSAFLTRLAARAVGQAAIAQPRLPSLFEAASEPSHSLDVIDDEVAVGPEAAVTRSVAPAPANSPAGDRTARAVSPVAASRAAAEAIRDVASQRTEPARRQDAIGNPGRRRARTVVADHAATEEQAIASDTSPVAHRSLIVPAEPLSVARPVASRSADEATRSARPSGPEPPAVRVHIGRLEIRANLPESAPARRPARQVREDSRSISLADYLRGAR